MGEHFDGGTLEPGGLDGGRVRADDGDALLHAGVVMAPVRRLRLLSLSIPRKGKGKDGGDAWQWKE
jgi:hypothetical protein